MGAKDKGVESNAKVKITERDFSTLHPAIQYNKCQGYRHAAVICPSPDRVVIDKLFITESESDSEEFIYQVKKPEDMSLVKKSRVMTLKSLVLQFFPWPPQ